MEKKFKIHLPELKINQEERKKEIRALFSNDFEKMGILNQCFIFCNLNEPASVTEVTDNMSKYYQMEFQRTAIFRALQRLVKLGLVHTTTSGEVVMMPSNERKEIHNHILAKYQNFLKKIPEPFKKRYTDVHYFWIANGNGLDFIEWCCKILKFDCKEE